MSCRGTLNSNCWKPQSYRGDIICNMPDVTINSGDKITPTWREPGHGVSLSDNGGTLTLDLCALFVELRARVCCKALHRPS